ncbi:hypothetical protein TNCV_1910221 [Trichonephila clavipes]|nr:hypothetical protein TNCV_1910221 [Trichonephila clavipes]
MSSSPVPLNTRCGGVMHVKSLKHPPAGVVWRAQLYKLIDFVHRNFERALVNPLLNVATNDEADFWLNGYVNKQNCRIWSEANPQVYVETPLHPEKLTVWCALWAGGILLQTR